MRPAVIVLGISAFVVAGGAGYMLQQYMAAQDARIREASVTPAVVAPKTTSVLVANDTLGVGKALDSSSLTWQDWPDKLAVDSGWVGIVTAKTDADKAAMLKSYEGSVTRTSFVKGEPITSDRVVMPGKGSTLATIIRPGMRSITIPVDPISSSDGLIQPGDHVDLILTYDLPDVGAGLVDDKTGLQRPHYVTETFLKDIPLLSMNKRFVVNSAIDAPVPTNATFEVTQLQAEKITTANKMGKIAVALRPLQVTDDPPINNLGFITDLSVIPGLQSARLGKPYDPNYNPFDPAIRKEAADAARVAYEQEQKKKAEDESRARDKAEEEKRRADAANQKPPTITIYRWSAPTQVQLDKNGKPVNPQQPNGASSPNKDNKDGKDNASGAGGAGAGDSSSAQKPTTNQQPSTNGNAGGASNPYSSGAGSGSNGTTAPSGNDKNIYHYNGPSHGV